MKIAVLGESGADEAFVPVIAEAILELSIETVSRHPRARGWPSVRNVLPAVFKELFYHSDADGLIVVADSDFSRIHRLSDEPVEASRDGCRACRGLVNKCVNEIRRRPSSRAGSPHVPR